MVLEFDWFWLTKINIGLAEIDSVQKCFESKEYQNPYELIRLGLKPSETGLRNAFFTDFLYFSALVFYVEIFMVD